MNNMKTLKANLIFMLMVMSLLFVGCKDKAKNNQSLDSAVNVSYSEEDLYRPNFHFTPKKAWMNDPNGMFYYNGYYHLYFQYHPESNV